MSGGRAREGGRKREEGWEGARNGGREVGMKGRIGGVEGGRERGGEGGREREGKGGEGRRE